jgi:YVTN family beta-propeller protein
MERSGKTLQRAGIVAAIVAVAACFAAASASAAPLAYVVNASSNSVSIVNTVTRQIVGQPIADPAFNQPFSVAMTPDGRVAYVANRFGSTVSVIDAATRQVIGKPIAVGESPTQVSVAPDGKTVWVADEGSNEVSVIDTQSNQVVRSIPVGGIARGVSITPDGKFAYVALYNKAAVKVIEATTGKSLGQIPVGEHPFNVTFTPDGKTAYVVNQSDDDVSVIDAATGQVTSIPVGENPWGFAIAPDGSRAYVVDFNSAGTISVIDTALDQVVKTIPVGEFPTEVALTPDGKTAYVTEAGSSNVVAIDTVTAQVIGPPIEFVGGGSQAIAITPNLSPTAAFTASSDPTTFTATFDGSASTDPDGTVTSYAWAFGDGSAASEVSTNLGTTATGSSAVHIYPGPGTYPAQLTVRDNEGCGVAEVFTGRTAYCSGNPAAKVTQPVVVQPPPSIGPTCDSKFAIVGVSHNRKNGTVRLRLKFPTTGWFLLFGKKIHAVTRKVRKPGTTTVTLHARVELNKELKKTLRASVKYRITFTPSVIPSGCGARTTHHSVALLRAPRQKHHS